MRTLPDLLENNRQWAEQVKKDQPDFFAELAKQQAPEFLWIGCADSRVPANQIVGLAPGEVFVHRNVANVVPHSDLNVQAVIEFAVGNLGVGDIIVCGHYNCGGVRAALEGGAGPLADGWIQNIRDVAAAHREELDTLDGDKRVDRLCELNVMRQVRQVARARAVQSAWQAGRKLAVHGWIYGLADGRLKDLEVTVTSAGEAETLAG